MFAFDTTSRNPRIAALQGASSAAIQSLLGDFALQMARRGCRIAGVVEHLGEGKSACGSRSVRDLSTGAVISISQNLGEGSTACNLDPSGLIEACAAVERAIAAGVDLVIISKFGKLEAERRGLSGAFRAAIDVGVPVLTSVSPAMTAAWRLFAGPLSQFIAPDAALIDAWWRHADAGLVVAGAERAA